MNKENRGKNQQKYRLYCSNIDDILNDSTNQSRPQQQQLSFSLPPEVSVRDKARAVDIVEEITLPKESIPFELVKLHGVDGSAVLSALKTLPQRDVVDALQSSSSCRLYFQHYDGDENKIIAKALVGATSTYTFADSGDRDLWCEALCSAYDACRSHVFHFDDQDDPSRFVFYVCAPSYTAVFQQSERDGMVAGISRSTPGMRRMFELYGITHHKGKDGLLLFRGEQSVHGLFDILLNTGLYKSSKIVAPVAFQNAALIRSPFRLGCNSSNDVTIHQSCIPVWVVSRLRHLLIAMNFTNPSISTRSKLL